MQKLLLKKKKRLKQKQKKKQVIVVEQKSKSAQRVVLHAVQKQLQLLNLKEWLVMAGFFW